MNVQPNAQPNTRMNTHPIRDAQAEALFISDLQPSQPVTEPALQAAIARVIQAHGSRGCAAMVAQEFGEHPETAVPRMRWARQAAARITVPPPVLAA